MEWFITKVGASRDSKEIRLQLVKCDDPLKMQGDREFKSVRLSAEQLAQVDPTGTPAPVPVAEVEVPPPVVSEPEPKAEEVVENPPVEKKEAKKGGKKRG